MPELPEVEHARKMLTKFLKNGQILSVKVLDPRVVEGAAKTFARDLTTRRVEEIDRRGKWLRLKLDNGSRLFSHLGMTGKWVCDAAGARSRSVCVEFLIRKKNQNSVVRYEDARRFGWLVLSTEDSDTWTSLGPDALLDKLVPAEIAERLARRKKSIKEVLLDQSLIAGVGNIQATEALFDARIHPERRANRLEPAELRKLLRAIVAVIKRTITHQEKHDLRYMHEANAPNPFRVYGREKQPCPRCGTLLVRKIIGGRTSIFCPHCQAL